MHFFIFLPQYLQYFLPYLDLAFWHSIIDWKSNSIVAHYPQNPQNCFCHPQLSPIWCKNYNPCNPTPLFFGVERELWIIMQCTFWIINLFQKNCLIGFINSPDHSISPSTQKCSKCQLAYLILHAEQAEW